MRKNGYFGAKNIKIGSLLLIVLLRMNNSSCFQSFQPLFKRK